ncbi:MULTISPECIES: hypothetical protein [Streptomyces]|uniref:hypothetical protein n=1 Tax=Streptomyces TaxID=1883 RepID=UPI00142D5E34|nr:MULTISPECIES: hypothetical protein [Streptomyces]
MHDIVFLLRGPLYLLCIVVLVWELDRKTTGRNLRKARLFSVIAALALAELLDAG